MSQFHLKQNQGDEDTHLWQQHLMYKQLQELQRLQQLQQFHGARQQNSLNPLFATTKSAVFDQVPAMVNEVSINDPSSCTWSNNNQMLSPGNMNLAHFGASYSANNSNCILLSDNHTQPLGSLGFVAQQPSQPIFDTLPSGTPGSVNHKSHFLGTSTDFMTKAGGNQIEEASVQSDPFAFQNKHRLHEQACLNDSVSNSMQNFQVQSHIGSVTSENYQQVNHLKNNIQLPEFHGKQTQGDWSGNSQEKFNVQVGTASGETCLDPTEQKLLFGTDENVNRGTLFERSANPSSTEVYVHGNLLESDSMGAFPSLQSGSWSALMQEALQASSSDNGIQEEWSGLSFQRTEQSITNPPSVHTNIDGCTTHPSVPSFQYPFKPAHEQERALPEFSCAPVPGQQSTEQGTNKNCYKNLKAKQSDVSAFQEQKCLSVGNWLQQTYPRSQGNSYSADMRLKQQSPQGSWIPTKNMLAHEPNGWKSNNFLPPSGEKSPSNVATHSGGDDNLGKNRDQPRVGHQALESSRANTEWASEDHQHEHQNVVSNGNHIINNSDHGRHIGREFAARVDSLFRAKDARTSDTGSQRSLGQLGQQTFSSHLLQNHTIGNIGMAAGSSFTPNPVMYSRVLHHSAPQDSNDMEQRFVGHTQVTGNIASNESTDVVERTSMGEGAVKSKCDIPDYGSTEPSFAGSTAAYLQNRTGQTRQYMLELLHKVDMPRNNNTSIAVDGPEQSAFDVSACGQQHNKPPPLQGFGLQLAPSSSIQSLPSTHSSQGEDANDRSNMSEDACKETTFLRHQMNLNASDFNYILQQQNCGLTGQAVNKKSLISSFGSQNKVNATYTKQTHESHGASGDQSVQEALPGFASRVPPFELNSLPDTLVPASSQFLSTETDCNGMSGANFSQARSSGQPFRAIDTRSGSQPAIPGMSHQAGAVTVFKNVWTNISGSAQARLCGLQPNKIPPRILQAMMLSNNSGSTRLWGLQKMDDQGKKRENASDAGTSSTNSHNRDERQVSANSAEATSSGVNVGFNRGHSSQEQEPLQKHLLGGSSNMPISTLVQVNQNGVDKAKHVGNLAADIRLVNASFTNAADAGNVGLHGQVVNPPDVHQHRYSLLHQVQAMKHADYDPGNSFGKNNSLEVQIESNIGSTSESWFPSDVKMLNFASRDNEERSVPVSSQLPSKVVSSHDICAARKHEIQNNVCSLGPSSAPNLMESNEHPKFSSQMAPSWFEQHGTYRNGQTIATYACQRATQQFNLTELSWRMDNVREQRTDSSQFRNFGQNIASSKVAATKLSSSPYDITAPSVVMRSKKRKSLTSELFSWHKVIEGPQKLRSISMTEMDWARATNRLIEKVEDEAEMLEDVPSFSRVRRRLILTTQLAQQLLPAVPMPLLRKQAASAYESMTYCVARVALGDACSLISCAEIDSRMDLDNDKIISERTSSEKLCNIFPKVVEVFIGRFKKLEKDFLRSKRTSMVDVQLECQEVERFSIVNRLGRFHGRSPTDGIEGSSDYDPVPRRFIPQRHVIPLSMPGNLPEGVSCLSL